MLCTVKESRMIRVSLGTAVALGLANVRCDVLPTTAYFLTTGGCVSRCAFCAQARSSNTSETFLSRVSWPKFPIDQVLHALATCNPGVKRVCIQVTSTPDARNIVEELAGSILEVKHRYGSAYEVSLSYHPSSVSDVESLLSQGVDRIGIALDAASQRIHDKMKKGSGSWMSTIRLLKESAAKFPGKISTHLIVGLGETEEELAKIMQRLRDCGITIGLFAFTPRGGDSNGARSQPQLDVH